jgi:hypothetical protein
MIKKLLIKFSLVALTFVWATAAFTQCLTIVPSVTTSSCVGQSTGSISLQVSGGSGNYTYSWTGPNNYVSQGASTVNGLYDGAYNCQVSDGSCIETIPVSISSPQLLTVTATLVPPSCFGFSNGEISLSLSGGNGNYIYDWSTGGTTNE